MREEAEKVVASVVDTIYGSIEQLDTLISNNERIDPHVIPMLDLLQDRLREALRFAEETSERLKDLDVGRG